MNQCAMKARGDGLHRWLRRSFGRGRFSPRAVERRGASRGRTRRGRGWRGFSLIELLVVVAVVAILAAIAVPNFLEAQIRAKASRAKAEMRHVATALESYNVDNNSYVDFLTPLTRLTTPVAYIPTLPEDVFQRPKTNQGGGGPFGDLLYFNRIYGYGSMPLDTPSRFVLSSVGPDTDIDVYQDGLPEPIALKFYPGYSPQLVDAGAQVNASVFRYDLYDPSNGTVSSGDVFRFSDGPAR